MFELTFDKQLDRTIKLGAKYTKECEKLKDKFCREYDKKTVITLLDLLISNGHPGEQMFATKFRDHYNSDNYSDQEMYEFKKLLDQYKEELVNTLESNGD